MPLRFIPTVGDSGSPTDKRSKRILETISEVNQETDSETVAMIFVMMDGSAPPQVNITRKLVLSIKASFGESAPRSAPPTESTDSPEHSWTQSHRTPSTSDSNTRSPLPSRRPPLPPRRPPLPPCDLPLVEFRPRATEGSCQTPINDDYFRRCVGRGYAQRSQWSICMSKQDEARRINDSVPDSRTISCKTSSNAKRND